MHPRFIEQTKILSCTTTRDRKVGVLEGLSWLFVEKLHVKPKEVRVLVIENILSEKSFRESLYRVLMVDLQVLSVCFQPDLFMPILATGCRSGCIVDIGYEEIRCLAICWGRALLSTIRGKLNTEIATFPSLSQELNTSCGFVRTQFRLSG